MIYIFTYELIYKKNTTPVIQKGCITTYKDFEIIPTDRYGNGDNCFAYSIRHCLNKYFNIINKTAHYTRTNEYLYGINLLSFKQVEEKDIEDVFDIFMNYNHEELTDYYFIYNNKKIYTEKLNDEELIGYKIYKG